MSDNIVAVGGQKFMRFPQVLWLLSGIVLIITFLTILIKVNASLGDSTLRYNIVIGVIQIGSAYELFKIPLSGLLLGAINYLLMKLNKSDHAVLGLLAGLITLIINLILLFASLLLLRVN